MERGAARVLNGPAEVCLGSRLDIVKALRRGSKFKWRTISLCHDDGGGSVEGAVVGVRRRAVGPIRSREGIATKLSRRGGMSELK